MKVLRVENDKKNDTRRFTIWVWARHNLIDWQDCAFTFSYEESRVYFLLGGQDFSKRFVSEAQSRDDAIKKATVYLEAWLRECRAID